MATHELARLSARSDIDKPVTLKSLLKGTIADLISQGMRIPEDFGVLLSIGETKIDYGLIDDEKQLLERIIQLAVSLPSGAKIGNDLTSTFIKTLWDNLRHPPISYLGDQFKYRDANGRYNNIMYPELGAAGSFYARSVTPQTPLPAVLPDASTIFDALFARKGSAKEHPNKLTPMLFYLATLIIHDLFHTDERDQTKVVNSSYLDLGPLYGHNLEQQNKVRTFKDGMLFPDTFSEFRLLGQPPGACALLVAFNRFHNYVVAELATINEGGRFGLPLGLKPTDSGYEAAQLQRDNDLFQTGRLITCGLYVNIILNDYVKTILNLNRSNSTWSLDPRENFSNVFDPNGTPQGIGNQVSVEFNLIYRWHCTTNDHDEAWAKSFFGKLFPGEDPSKLPLIRFLNGLRKWQGGIPTEPKEWAFGDLKRKGGKEGPFEDADLVELIQVATENAAGAFGARNIPAIMKAIEMLGIEQARKWKVATLNEVRVFFKLKPHASFLEINPDVEVAGALEALYGSPDKVELYPGLIAEQAKAVAIPGSGLCPGLTIGKAILSDAVALVRGDRFYTVDYCPANLTNWGYTFVANDTSIAGGGVFYKLLMTAFPGYYRSNSVYAMFPFVTPVENQNILRSLGKEQDYDYSKPKFIGPPTPVLTWDGVTSVLGDQKNFKVPWGPHTFYLTGHDYMLSGDSPANAEQKVFVKNAVYKPQVGLDEIRQFYEGLTTKMIYENSRKLGDVYQLDVVRDVANVSHANFIANMFNIPLQSAGGDSHAYTEQTLYKTLSDLFAYVFLDFDTLTSFALRASALKETKDLGKVVQRVVEKTRHDNFENVMEHLGLHNGVKENILQDFGTHLIKRLSEDGKSVDEVVWTIIPTAAAAVATQAQALSQLLDFYLSDDNESHWLAIQKLAKSDSPEDFEKLKKYALEGFRLATPAFGLLRIASAPVTIQDGPRTTSVAPGSAVFVSFISAGLDASKFPNPTTVDPARPEELYIHHGWGAHACLGRPIVTTAAAAQLRVFGRLKGLKRAEGARGEMKFKMVNGAFKVFLGEEGDRWERFPVNKKVVFEGFGG